MNGLPIRTMEPRDAVKWLKDDDAPQFIDVRTHQEHQLSSVEGARLLPMDDIMNWVQTLDPSRPVLVLCHHGIRSMRVAMYLHSCGFTDPVNLTGGIDRWSIEIDEAVPRY